MGEATFPAGSPRRRISRRAFLAGTGALTVATWSARLWTPERARALAAALDGITDPTGTTLVETYVREKASGYSRLISGPGWPTVVRADLATPGSARVANRTALASFVHVTDIHLVDAQSPGRVEFLDKYGSPLTAATRPQETLSTHVGSSMVTKLNALRKGPVTGRPFDCLVSTGDNIDNMQLNEARWFLTLLDGGDLVPDSGTPGVYEGVQDGLSIDLGYWHPEPSISDGFKTTLGFPSMPGLLDAAIVPYSTPGLAFPWYSTYGNHDSLLQGNLPIVGTNNTFDTVLAGDKKVVDLKTGQSAADFLVAMFGDPQAVANDILAGGYPTRTVGADADRRSIRPREWVQLHLDSPATPGPVGHGYTQDNFDRSALYYSFPLAPNVLGVSLDTGGYSAGSIGQYQIDWLEQELRSVHSRYFDPAGNEVRTGATDQLVILFSHFTVGTLSGAIPDPDHPEERRYVGPEMVQFLQRWPNVIAWVNGHTHQNHCTPFPDPTGQTGGFWEINTAAHIDHPELARIIELVDNHDGTLSLWCTMVEHAAPAQAPYDDTSVLGLASINRELSANDPQVTLTDALGQPTDLNVELVVKAPFPYESVSAPPAVTAQPVFTG